MQGLFAVTLFVSATLLFLVQPMIARMLLPKFGGAAAVWNTCMVFFQASLLAGYAYAHLATSWLGVRRQAALHLVLILLPLAVLPIAVAESWAPAADQHPIPWLLGLLVTVVGLPFFIVSASAPLLQKWFAGTGQPGAEDPYYLYAGSNLGSMAALVAYPVLVEPNLTLQAQGRLWAAGYGLFVVLAAACAVALWRGPAGTAVPPRPTSPQPPAEGLTWGTCLRWVALAFVPSSLMLGATTHLTTDLSPFPLLWVLPLAVYLLSFILVFSQLPSWVHPFMIRILPVIILIQAFVMITGLVQSIGKQVILHLLTLFVVAMVCHGELARTRPPTRHLTAFYLWMSLGGVLGGLCNALVAPLVFSSIAEYPLALVLACLLWPGPAVVTPGSWRSRILDFVLPALLAMAAVRVVMMWQDDSTTAFVTWVDSLFRTERQVPQPGRVRAALAWSLPVVACYFLARRPLRLGMGVLALFLAGYVQEVTSMFYVFQERNFFGVLRVELANEGTVVRLAHGSTLHGGQLRSENPVVRRTPLYYFWPTGPVGQYFDALEARGFRKPIAVMGLGAGALASYVQPGQDITFFEIDPAVIRVANDPDFFTYLKECKGNVRIELGDARLRMAEEPDGHYGLIVMDAFSSDAIPVHLITREALRLYLSKLAEGGIIAVQISNKHISLEPVLANLARAENLVCLSQLESRRPVSADELRGVKLDSDWVLLARRLEDLGPLTKDPRWRQVSGKADGPVWTDDFSNLFSVIRW